MPPNVPRPPCGGRTDNCEAKGEAQRLQDKAETVTCNVTEYELTCKWEPRIVPKTCTVMVPQYKAVCAGNKKLQATVQRTYNVDTRFDANNDGVIQQAEFEAARAAGGAQMGAAMGGGAMGGFQAGGGGMGQFGAQTTQNRSSFSQSAGGAMGGGYGGSSGQVTNNMSNFQTNTTTQFGGPGMPMGGGGYGN